MSEIAVAQMRNRMLKETEGFLSKKLALASGKRTPARKELAEYVRRFALRQGQLIDDQLLRELSL